MLTDCLRHGVPDLLLSPLHDPGPGVDSHTGSKSARTADRASLP